jgi:L-fuculose-phosphate aldolase
MLASRSGTMHGDALDIRTGTMTHGELRQRLAIAGKILAAEGQGDFTRGHISARLPDDPALFLMKPHSVGLDEIAAENLLTIGLDGEVVAGQGRRHSEVYIHSEVYKARGDVNCVLHTHPPYAVALSATGRPMRAYSQPGALFCEALGVYDGAISLIRSPAMGARVAQALGAHRAALLKNHGIVAAAATIEECVVTALMLENAAKVQMIAEAAGGPAPEFPRADIENLKSQLSKPDQFRINFDYLARRVGRSGT